LLAQDENVIHLEHADSLVGLVLNGEQVRQLIGNVKFKQGKMTVTCKRAIQYLRSDKIGFEGEAEFYDGSMRMVASRGTYDGVTKTAEAFDRVMLEDSGTTINAAYGKYFFDQKMAHFTTNVSVSDSASQMTSDLLTYYRTEEHAIADGNVKIRSFHRQTTLYGDHFENFRKKSFSRMTGGPRLVQVDTAGAKKETLLVAAKTMESYRDTLERLVAQDSVRMVRGGLQAEGGYALLYTVLDSIILRKSPLVWYSSSPTDDNQVSGDSIFIKMDNHVLKSVYVRGSAFAISRADSLFANRFNQMSGQEIVMRFDSNQVKSVDVDRTATSLYYLFEEGKGNGMNKSSGDHVTLSFADGKIDKIKILGGVEGKYYPEKMIANKEADFNLTGFDWRVTRPRQRLIRVQP
jgi:lipopolysaccharide export system protein LptA